MYCIFKDGKVERIEKKLPDNFKTRTPEQLATQNIYEFVIDSSDASDTNKFTHYEDTLNGSVVTRKYVYVEKTTEELKPFILSRTKETLYSKILNKYDLQEQVIILSGVLGQTKRTELLTDFQKAIDAYVTVKRDVDNIATVEDVKTILSHSFFK